jgi:hypothetical protein
MMNIEAPEHTHLLPSILSAHMSYPLTGMNRINPLHHLPNWIFNIAIRRKLLLPIYDTSNSPICICSQIHDCWGITPSNVGESVKKQHTIIRDSLAEGLQPALSTAGIRPATKLDIERTNIHTSDTGAQPFDFSFNPDPNTSQENNTHCPYTTFRANITIAHTCKTTYSLEQLDCLIFDGHCQ